MQEIEPEEQAGDLLIDETLFEEDEEDLPKEQLRNTSAAYLLQLKETYNLSQKSSGWHYTDYQYSCLCCCQVSMC